MKSIEENIWENAHLNPTKTALKSGNKSVTYKELTDSIYAAKLFFERQPYFVRGGSVILAAGKQLGFAFSYFGAHLAGLKVIPIDSETNATRFLHISNMVKPLCLIGFEKQDCNIPKLSLKEFDNIEKVESEDFNEFPDVEEMADILFTTGTTGEPKGVPLTFHNEASAARNINAFIGNSKDDVELLALPISHSFGLGRMRCCLSIGATLILQGSFVNTKKLFRIIEEDKVTGFTMVPASWRFLRKMSGDKLADYSNQLRYIEMGSAHFSAEDKKKLADLFPSTRVAMHYGLTEASRSAFMEFHEDGDHLDSVGKASPYTDIQIFDEKGNMLPTNTEGEICVKGEHVTKGYINQPSADIYFGEYFRTGDWGTIDEKGYIYLKSRKKELINVGGKKVSPLEVEDQLLKISGIQDCACVGIPDPNGVLGEVVKAYIVKGDNAELRIEDIAQQMSGTLESYKLPVEYEWISEIPKTQNGKILRSKLS